MRTAVLLIVISLLTPALPARAGDSFGQLESAGFSTRTFDGGGIHKASPALSVKGLDRRAGEKSVRDGGNDRPGAKSGKGKKFLKKAAPYAWVAGVGIWIGLAVTGALAPAIAVAGMFALLYAASR